MSDSASAEGLRDPWTWLHDNEWSWDDVNAIAAILGAGGFDIVESDSGTHGHDVPGVGYLWWNADGKIIGGPEDD